MHIHIGFAARVWHDIVIFIMSNIAAVVIAG
jgi:hypothetical protein